MGTLPVYRVHLASEWIDYNGHLRDAYYGLILSYAIDEVMDHLGLDAAYRQRSGCTLYTLEMHLHFLHEVKSTDILEVQTSVLDSDLKRLHAGCLFIGARAGPDETHRVVAAGEVMLMHVQQSPTPAGAPFPVAVEQTLAELRLPAAAVQDWGPSSRKIEIKRRSPA